MPKVLILPHYHYENDFVDFLNQANIVQTDFKFYLLPPESTKESPLRKPIANYLEILEFLDSQKKQMNLDLEDLLIAFYDGVITAFDYGFTNLFIAGANAEDPYPCTAAVSLRFISWGILEQKYDYSLQRHALFHLVMCALIGGYTKVSAHHDTYGCLLDFNNQLVDFNHKLQMGYYLCSTTQNGCYNSMRSENYGNSIIRLCQTLKGGIDQKKLQIIIKELVMGNQGDTYNVQQAGAVGKYARSDNNAFFQSEQNQTFSESVQKIQQLIKDFEKTNSIATEEEKITHVNDNTTPSFKRRVVSALQAGSDTAIEEFLDNSYINVIKSIIKGWIQPE